MIQYPMKFFFQQLLWPAFFVPATYTVATHAMISVPFSKVDSINALFTRLNVIDHTMQVPPVPVVNHMHVH